MIRALDGGPALAAARPLGPFAAVSDSAGPGWVSWAEVVDEPELLRGRVAEVAGVLRSGPGTPDVPDRVAASLAHLGLVARLVSPLLGAALVTGVLPVAAPARVALRLTGANPLPLTFGEPDGVAVADGDELARAFTQHWIIPAVAPLGAAVHRAHGLSDQVLTGNAASAVAGALGMTATSRPALRRQAAAVLGALLSAGPLAGAGEQQHGVFTRRSCCLLYRLPGAGTCGDCILTGHAGRGRRDG